MPKTIEGLQGAGKVPNKAISVKTRDATPKPGMIPTLTRPCLACINFAEISNLDDDAMRPLDVVARVMVSLVSFYGGRRSLPGLK